MLRDDTRTPIFFCIGTMKHLLDSVAPRVGTKLQNEGYLVIGSETNQIHAKNISSFIELCDTLDKSMFQIIAIDALRSNSKDKIRIINRPCSPGSGIGKELGSIGEFTIGINICHDTEEESMLSFLKRMLFHEEKELENIEDLVECTVNYIKKEFPLTEIYQRNGEKKYV